MRVYTYRPGVYVYEAQIDLPEGSPMPELATLTPPLPPIDPSVAITWNPKTSAWEYHEIPLGANVPKGYMDELLTYADIRILHYPPKEDYLDAIVKNDTQAMQAYTDACLNVKARWPKDMDPITRRAYFVQVHDMKPFNTPLLP